jgi:hypothetical protein
MALYVCPECGNKVSSFATSCPKCGCPIDRVLANGVLALPKDPLPAEPVDKPKAVVSSSPKKKKESVADRVERCHLKFMCASDSEYARGVAYFKNDLVKDFKCTIDDDTTSIIGTVSYKRVKIVMSDDQIGDRFEETPQGGLGKVELNLLDGEEVALILFYLKTIYSKKDFKSIVPLSVRGLKNRKHVAPGQAPVRASDADFSGLEDPEDDLDDGDDGDHEENSEMDDYDEDGCPVEESESDDDGLSVSTDDDEDDGDHDTGIYPDY